MENLTEKNEIKHLLLDLGGVLILRQTTDWNVLGSRFNIEGAQLKLIIQDCFTKQAADKNFQLEQYYNDKYKNQLSFEDYKEVVKSIHSSEYVNTLLLEWLIQNKQKFTISAVTNNTAGVESLLNEKFNINGLFGNIFNSAEIGFTKPDPNFFKYVINFLKVPPDECIFVDDNLQNVLGAESVGLIGIHFIDTVEFINKMNTLLI